ncbi:hypothetical protein [Fictibacillus barbaricus]|uniref:Uncharacterized protein n=1 Tax=Fictibacillus barbaricus TaxID=182136 RepID=A0ABU1U5J3_9BACL|nr:hypothetical protein [Fictibacillus barbaricus]MDR7074671.1 hypothetical protein [Fictibacillus barbaricus]
MKKQIEINILEGLFVKSMVLFINLILESHPLKIYRSFSDDIH